MNRMKVRQRQKYSGYSPSEVTVNDLPALFMSNGFMEIMTKNDFYEMLEMMKIFYDSEDVEEWIEKQNAINRWIGHPLLGTELKDEKYVLPEPQIDQRQFRNDLKRNWGFNCEWCNTKVSSKTDKEYFWINEQLNHSRGIQGKCCTKACAENLWYDLLIEWIRDEKLTDVFHTDKAIKV